MQMRSSQSARPGSTIQSACSIAISVNWPSSEVIVPCSPVPALLRVTFTFAMRLSLE